MAFAVGIISAVVVVVVAAAVVVVVVSFRLPIQRLRLHRQLNQVVRVRASTMSEDCLLYTSPSPRDRG